MQITAQLKNLRIAPRKMRLVSGVIKGMDAVAAKHHLAYIIKRSSAPISKLLDSAMANAHNNLGLVKENLFIKDITVDEGPKLKRFRPKAMGMASPIEKKTSHIRIVLDEKVPGLKAKDQPKPKKAEEKAAESVEVKLEKTKIHEKKPEVHKELGKKGGVFGKMSGLGKKFFRRKAI